jgi:hypothetical protein
MTGPRVAPLVAPGRRDIDPAKAAELRETPAAALLDLMRVPDGLLSQDAVTLRRSLRALIERLNLGEAVAVGFCDTCGDPALLFSGRHGDLRRCFGCCLPEFRS